jgi:hypothetical protein
MPQPAPATPDDAFVDVTFTVESNYAGWRLDRVQGRINGVLGPASGQEAG